MTHGYTHMWVFFKANMTSALKCLEMSPVNLNQSQCSMSLTDHCNIHVSKLNLLKNPLFSRMCTLKVEYKTWVKNMKKAFITFYLSKLN